jgi:hypothetical protein
MELSPTNRIHLSTIESAAFTMTLTDWRFNDDAEVNDNLVELLIKLKAIQYALVGECRAQWADKSTTVHVHANAQATSNSDVLL